MQWVVLNLGCIIAKGAGFRVMDGPILELSPVFKHGKAKCPSTAAQLTSFQYRARFLVAAEVFAHEVFAHEDSMNCWGVHLNELLGSTFVGEFGAPA